MRSADLIGNIALVVIFALIVFVVVSLVRAVRIVPQSQAYVVERLGRFQAVMRGGFHLLVPFVDRVAARVDLREQVANFPPQPVITADQAMVSIDSVIYFQITDPRGATYEVANFLQAIEQLTATTLRNLIGSLDLEQTQTSRESINKQLRGVLDEATGPWGIRVTRVAVLAAPAQQVAQVLHAKGQKEALILQAEGARQAQILRAQGESEAIQTVFAAINAGKATPELLSYKYLEMLPKIADGQASKLWMLPSDLTGALESISKGFNLGK